jgi:hypothetical protein
MDENLNVAANVEEVATPQDTAVETTNTEVTAEPTEILETTETKEDITQTQAFSQRLKEATTKAEQRAMDKVIAEVYGSQGINTYAQYQEAMQRQQREQEAQQKGIDPEFYGQFKSMEEKLNSIEREKTMLMQEQQLSNDPKVGALFNEWKGEVKQLAQQYNVDLDTAFTILTRERIADVMSSQRVKAEQETIKGLQQNATTTPGALGVGGQEAKQDFSKMTSKDFEELTQRALRGELSKF